MSDERDELYNLIEGTFDDLPRVYEALTDAVLAAGTVRTAPTKPVHGLINVHRHPTPHRPAMDPGFDPNSK